MNKNKCDLNAYTYNFISFFIWLFDDIEGVNQIVYGFSKLIIRVPSI